MKYFFLVLIYSNENEEIKCELVDCDVDWEISVGAAEHNFWGFDQRISNDQVKNELAAKASELRFSVAAVEGEQSKFMEECNSPSF